MTDFDQRASIIEHLVELRTRVIRSIAIVILGFIACYFFSEQIFNFLRAPIQSYLPGGGLHYTAVMEKFMAHIKVSFLAGVLVTSPLWLWQLWKFIAPGLYSHEKKYALGFLSAAIFFFLGGAAFAYYLAMPAAFRFLFHFGGTTDQPIITIDSYLDFVVKLILAFGAAFEMPVVIVFLGLMGIIDAKMLSESRRYAIVVLAIISAVITPPDAISMLALLVPLWLLYELSVLAVKVLGPQPPIRQAE